METTQYFDLKKPELLETADLSVWNSNMDTVDSALHECGTGAIKTLWTGCALEASEIQIPNDFFYNRSKSLMILVNGFMAVSSDLNGIPGGAFSLPQGKNFASVMGINMDTTVMYNGSPYIPVSDGKELLEELFYLNTYNGTCYVHEIGDVSIEIAGFAGNYTISLKTRSNNGTMVPTVTSISVLKME